MNICLPVYSWEKVSQIYLHIFEPTLGTATIELC